MRRNTSNKCSPPGALHPPSHSESGFTMLEMMVALVILLIGMLGMEAAIGYALMVTNSGRNVTNTKLLIVPILEQMETLRNTRQLTYGQIANQVDVDDTGAAQPFNGFPATFEAVSISPGPDGIHGTTDDLIAAGLDGVYGTKDDVLDQSLARPGFMRQILITPLSANLKQITVTLRYPSQNGATKTQVGISYLNNDARNNFLR